MKKINTSALPFLDKKRKIHIAVTPLTEKAFPQWMKKQPARMKALAEQTGFRGQPGKIFIPRDEKGKPAGVILGVSAAFSLYDLAPAVQTLRQHFSSDFLKGCSFGLESGGMKKEQIDTAFIGWALACYQFSEYRKNGGEDPALLWDKKASKKRVTSFAQALFHLRDLINMPSNAMGPDELEDAAAALAEEHGAKLAVTKGKALETGFPLVHAVGDGSPRRPRLLDLRWGKAKDPKLTIVGKGVCFDTGGLNLKPAGPMALMKKDMGGAAHALALGHLIMSLGVPVRLRILIPAVENSVSGAAFRPGDIFRSRKGLTVENTNTDAEGRLILADTLSYACEEKPDLLIDFATLTGSARAALGPDIPAMFSNSDRLAEQLKKLAFAVEDPVWPMPLWAPYNRHNESSAADMMNSSAVPGDLVYSALFLQRFLSGDPEWIHLDCYAWEHTGRPGRPRGGADTGLRAAFALIEERYGR